MIPCRKIAAIRMWLCWRLIITSEQTSAWNVPVINLRINISSSVVSDARRPSCKLAVKQKNFRFPHLTVLFLQKYYSQTFHEFQAFLSAIKCGGFAISYVRGLSRFGVILYRPAWTRSHIGVRWSWRAGKHAGVSFKQSSWALCTIMIQNCLQM